MPLLRIFENLKQNINLTNFENMKLQIFLLFFTTTIIQVSFATDVPQIETSTEAGFCFECKTKNKNSFSPIASTLCEMEMKEDACKKIPSEDLKDCKNLYGDIKGAGDVVSLIGRCAVGFFDSAIDLLKFTWLALKTTWDKTIHPSETYQESLEHAESVKLYLSTEYDRAYDKATFPKKVKAGLAVASSILQKIYNSVEEHIYQTYKEFKCLNTKAKSQMMCHLIGDFIIPPVAALSIWKYGFKNLKQTKKPFKLTFLKKDPLNGDSNKHYLDKYELEPRPLVKQKYTDVKQRYQYLLNNTNGADFFHGSNSASLISVIKNEKGLVPTGQLSDVPFGGEVANGVSKKGVNQDTISATRLEDIDLAVDYTKKDFNNEGWSVKNSKSCIDFLKSKAWEMLPGCNKVWKKKDLKLGTH